MRISGGAVIATERLELTPLRPGDATEMAVVLGDQRLHEFTGGSPVPPDQLGDRFRRLTAGPGRPGEIWLNWIIRLLGTGQAVGTVQATVSCAGETTSASVAWVVGVPWQGLGYASEAAVALVTWLARAGTTTVTASIAPGHHASERVARRAGLALTGRWTDGERIWSLPVRPGG